MRILLIAISLFLGLNATAHGGVVIKEADKVIIKTGMSHKKVMGMIHCLNTLKKYDTEEQAMGEAKAKIKEHCTKMGMDDEKCAKKQRKVARMIYNCFAKAEFMHGFLIKKTE